MSEVSKTKAKPRGAALKAGPGRPKGLPNKTTTAVKEALQKAFDGLGGVDALIGFGRANPAEFYKLWAKMLPTEVKAEVTGDMGLTVVVQRFADDQPAA